MAKEVFISYSRKDIDAVRKIKDYIEGALGIECWFDINGIESGEQFEDVIIDAIKKHDTVLFMKSAQSMNSEWALDELDFAKRKKKRIVLVHIDNSEMTDKFYFRYHKYDQIVWSDPIQRNKLINNLAKWFHKELSLSLQSKSQNLSTKTRTQREVGELVRRKSVDKQIRRNTEEQAIAESKKQEKKKATPVIVNKPSTSNNEKKYDSIDFFSDLDWFMYGEDTELPKTWIYSIDALVLGPAMLELSELLSINLSYVWVLCIAIVVEVLKIMICVLSNPFGDFRGYWNIFLIFCFVIKSVLSIMYII